MRLHDKKEFKDAINTIINKFGADSVESVINEGNKKFEVRVAHDREYPCEYNGPGVYGSNLIYDTFKDFWDDIDNFGNHYIGIDGDHHLAEYTLSNINNIPCDIRVSEHGTYSLACQDDASASLVVSWIQGE